MKEKPLTSLAGIPLIVIIISVSLLATTAAIVAAGASMRWLPVPLIVAGAVGMVEMALTALQKNAVVELDEERKAHMVSNLLTVLCSDRGTQPIVNAGSLY